ncbi:MAG: RHS repeat-associated core domain-containing protein, partial [Chlamydiae bacterium]|nr:RHS repeat-associated core domain-containing protein [Chlamydiota bacterium]
QDNIEKNYLYNDEGELIVEDPGQRFEYDALGNLLYSDGVDFSYDKKNRLIKAISQEYAIGYTYDDLGRRTSKTVNGEKEIYGHIGINEVAIFNSCGQLKELRIPGFSCHKDILRPIAIETKDAIYAPIHDIQGNIIKLIDIATREVIPLGLPDPFGRGLSKEAPTSWIFSGKYYDREVDLVYFGHRYYSPKLRKWLSPDPACQSVDLYQYCFNNPFSYFDPDGRSAEKVQEHFDNAKGALLEAITHSMAVAATADFPPLAAIEVYNATKCWIDAATEYNKGCAERERDQEQERESRDMVIEKERD